MEIWLVFKIDKYHYVSVYKYLNNSWLMKNIICILIGICPWYVETFYEKFDLNNIISVKKKQ